MVRILTGRRGSDSDPVTVAGQTGGESDLGLIWRGIGGLLEAVCEFQFDLEVVGVSPGRGLLERVCRQSYASYVSTKDVYFALGHAKRRQVGTIS
jgi:hypothetical protein